VAGVVRGGIKRPSYCFFVNIGRGATKDYMVIMVRIAGPTK
jgi:hypothetical protein